MLKVYVWFYPRHEKLRNVSDHVAETKDIFFQFETTDKEYRFQLRLLTLKDAKKGHRALLAKINVLSTNNRAIVFHSIGRKIYSVAEKGVTYKQQKVKSEKYTVLYAQALALLHLIEKNLQNYTTNIIWHCTIWLHQRYLYFLQMFFLLHIKGSN